MPRVVATRVVRGDRLQLALNTNARVTVPSFYGNLECIPHSYLDRLELVFIPHDDREYKRNILINARRGVMHGIFPKLDEVQCSRTVAIYAYSQGDGTYKTTLLRDTDGSYEYYFDHRSTDSEYSDLVESLGLADEDTTVAEGAE